MAENTPDKFYGFALIFTGICILVFLTTLLTPVVADNMLLVSSQVMQRPWTVISHIFLHVDARHLYFNMFALALFGSILEKYIGSKNFLMVFFSTGIVSSIADVLFYPATLGASGAVFGLLGCLTIIRPKQVVWALGVPMYIIIAAVIWILLDLTGMFYPDNIAHASHLFGMGSGMLIGFQLRGKYKAGGPRKPKEVHGEEDAISEKELDEWEKKYMKR
jgi:membrane associated rhomboid family serine protease